MLEISTDTIMIYSAILMDNVSIILTLVIYGPANSSVRAVPDSKARTRVVGPSTGGGGGGGGGAGDRGAFE